jgi:hypothetical protein
MNYLPRQIVGNEYNFCRMLYLLLSTLVHTLTLVIQSDPSCCVLDKFLKSQRGGITPQLPSPFCGADD